MKKNKTYLALKEEVWDRNLCSGCGACVSVCPADALFFSEESEVFAPLSSGYCKQENDQVPCGACYEVCPRTRPKKEEILGSYIQLTGAKSKTEIAHKQSGGAVTALLLNGFLEGFIDGVITVTEDMWTHRPVSILITNSGELMEHAGSRYNWSVPVLKALKTAVITKKLKKIAIVGTPCVVQAARLMKTSSHDLIKPYGESIRIIIGLFCTESFDYYTLMEKILKNTHNIPPYVISKMDVKGKLDLNLKDGSFTSIPLKEIEEAIKDGCRVCTDFSALDSDISAGSIGTDTGWTTLIIRTDEGNQFITSAVHSNSLELSGITDLDAIMRLAEKKYNK